MKYKYLGKKRMRIGKEYVWVDVWKVVDENFWKVVNEEDEQNA